ncbi:MAG: universal stress protein [Flavobacteriaceae bacterium]|nr:universal stress protein [Flavobacteriaceae bacterium]
MKTILFPTDFSENALNAIRYGLELYKNVPSQFILLHAYDVNNYVEGSAFEATPIESKLEDSKKQSDKKLKELKNNLEAQNKNPQHLFEVISKNYTLIDAINDQLDKKDIEVIIIGTQGNTTKYELDYGSHTIAILENIKNCPIMAVPRNERFTGLKEIVLANGYNTGFEARDFNYLIDLSKSNKSPIRVLHISETGGLNQSQEEKKESLKTILIATETSFHMLEHVSVPVGIYCFSESRNSDMISFVNKKYTFIEKLLFKPLYKNLGNYAKIPVLVLHKTTDD